MSISTLAVITVAGVMDTRKASSSAEFRSFLLSLCPEALESTTNFLVEGSACHDQTRTVLLVLSLLVDAGCNVRAASCCTDVGDVSEAVLEELVDKPGTMCGTYFSVLHFIRAANFDKLWFLATGPHVRISVIFAEFSE